MNDRADKPSEQSPIARLAELQVFQFITDALREGQRAILVTGRGQASMRVPEAVLAACASASTRTLHIGPPLPEPPELQEMIGAAVEIAGGREMTTQAMARLLLFADPRPTVILAIDDADTLPDRSLSYLALMTELLAPEAPILQIVLAAGPALLDRLAQPEFERFRNRLCRPGFETFQTLHVGRASGAFSGLRKPAHRRAAAGLAHLSYADPMATSPHGRGVVRPAVYAAGGVVAVGCLAAIGYVAFSAFAVGPILPPIASLNSAAEQLVAAGNGDRAGLSPNAAAPAPPSAAPDQNVDAAPPAMLAKAAPTAADDPTALSAEQSGAAVNGDRATLSPNAAGPVPPSAAQDQTVDAAPPAMLARAAPTAPNEPTALSAEQLGAAGNGDRAALSPNAAAPAPPSAAPDQNVDAAPPGMLPRAAPAAPDDPTALSAEQLGAAGNGDRAALSPNAAAPSAALDQNADAARPATVAKAAPTTSDGVTTVVAGLPALAPVRVILNVAREDAGRARRWADVQRALAAAGMDVSDLVPVDAEQPEPSIGYYFQSDRKAAAEVSHLLEPLLGAVDPVALRKHGSIPEPGTIEIAIPRSTTALR